MLSLNYIHFFQIPKSKSVSFHSQHESYCTYLSVLLWKFMIHINISVAMFHLPDCHQKCFMAVFSIRKNEILIKIKWCVKRAKIVKISEVRHVNLYWSNKELIIFEKSISAIKFSDKLYWMANSEWMNVN